MRIVAGSLRGRALAAPQGGDIRPTSDRVREALFNILAHGVDDFQLEGAHVLDLFAGTGALGLEALSRGAAFAIFVELAADARGLIRENVEAFELSGVTRIYRRDACQLGAANARDVADLVFLDPPYNKDIVPPALAGAAAGGWLRFGAVVVIEEAHKAIVDLPTGFATLSARSYGDTQLIIARYLPAG